jgi:hypothetical protein
MLGRHIYRVSAVSDGTWIVEREGDADRIAPKGGGGASQQAIAAHGGKVICEDKAAAIAAAVARAQADLPSKVIIEKTDGTLDAERVFGADEGLMEDPNRLE